MKFLTIFTLFVAFAFCDETKWHTLSAFEISELKNPFLNHQNTQANKIIKNQPQANFRLEGLMTNSVKIRGKWLKIGDTIEGYKLFKIEQSSAIFKFANENIKVNFSKENRVKVR